MSAPLSNFNELHRAARDGDCAAIKLLLAQGSFDINARCAFGPPLNLAVLNQHDEAVKVLIEAGADLSNGGEVPSALQVALDSNRSPSMLDILLSAGAKISDPKKTALTMAARTDNHYAVKRLLATGAEVDGPVWPDGSHRLNPLLVVCGASANVDTIRALLDARASVKLYSSKAQESALYLLARNPRASLEALSLLIAAGADVNACTVAGLTPVWEALFRGIDIVKLLVEAGAKLDGHSAANGSLLHHLCLSMRYLTTSIEADVIALVRYLVSKGAEPNAQNAKQQTPLHLLCQRYEPRFMFILHTLLDCGGDLTACDDAGDTPLHFAAHRGEAAKVALLLEYGANPRALNRDNKTPLDLASENPVEDCIALLKRRPVKLL